MCLINFYHALVRSRIDYDFIVIHPENHQQLKKLDLIYNSVLRFVSGIFYSRAVSSLNAETGEPLYYALVNLLFKPYHIFFLNFCLIFINSKHVSTIMHEL